MKKATLRSLATSLVKSGRVKTTLGRARKLRPAAERLITWAKKGKREKVEGFLYEKKAREKLFDLAQKFKGRKGGYTRILKLPEPRKGNGAEMALIEWIKEK